MIARLLERRSWSFSDLHAEVTEVAIEGDLAGWLVPITGRHTGDGLGFPATAVPQPTA